jgi:lipoprotein-anchoring transpeptidase ErfK/SrfK
MSARLTRRNFLSLAAYSAWLPFLPSIQTVASASGARAAGACPAGLGRVTLTNGIYVYSQPTSQSEKLRIARRDELLPIQEEITTDSPAHNPRWYHLEDGYVHSGYIQRVEKMHLNIPPLKSIPGDGQLGEISVPFVQSYRRIGSSGWEALYRLYYQSVHWITAVGEGPSPGIWYQITDDLLQVRHYVPASYMRPITPEEIAPISPDIAPESKRIEIHLQDQRLLAFENEQVVLECQVATGVATQDPQPDEIPTDTPAGRFYVQTKWPSRHMGDGRVTSDPQAYELPGVPWVCIFHKDGLALHGTFWHDNFGRRMSHGCVNLPNDIARWLFRWTTPVAAHSDRYTRGMGTRLDIS